MPPPPVRPLKKVNKVEQQKDKGKGKAKRVETKVGVEEMWVDKFAPTSRVRFLSHAACTRRCETECVEVWWCTGRIIGSQEEDLGCRRMVIGIFID